VRLPVSKIYSWSFFFVVLSFFRFSSFSFVCSVPFFLFLPPLRVVVIVVIIAQAEKLLDRGLHPVRIAEGYDKACQIGVKTLADISDKVDVQKGDASKTLFNTASTTLSSKIVNVHRDQVVRCCCCCS
jgi:hypothetical protein